jgi:hypothetical protein
MVSSSSSLMFVVLLGTVGTAGAAPVPALPDTGAAAPDSLPRYVLPDSALATGSLLSLREIVRRATEGERTKLAGHRDMTYNATLRSILTWKSKREIHDDIALVFEDDRGFQKRITLASKVTRQKRRDGKWVLDETEPGDVEVTVEAGDSDEGMNLSRVPFFLRRQEDFDFSLLERHLEGDHVIFKIAFTPRSTFKPLPSGTVYIDTNAFRVIHEEFRFDENPFPLLVKDIRRFSRQWTELPGGQWVVSRIMGDLTLRGGWTGVIPQRAEVALAFNDYRFDQGYDAGRFGPYGEGSQ